MKPDDVVVTGIGMVTPLGADAPTTARAWRSGIVASRRRLDELSGTPLERADVAALPEFDAAERLGGRRMLKYMSEAALLGCVAAREATLDAELSRRFRPERVGLYAGTGLAATSVREVIPMMRESIDEAGRFSCRLLGERGLARTNPLLSFKILANMPPCLVSILENVRGPNFIFTPWEGQTAAALCEAWKAVAHREVDCALAGASDDATNPATFVYLRQSGLLDEGDPSRSGEIPAAAGAYVVMERFETAQRGGRRVYAGITDMDLVGTDTPAGDPLAGRMGRSFAAAPAVFLAIGCAFPDGPVCMSGVDRQEFRAELEAVA